VEDHRYVLSYKDFSRIKEQQRLSIAFHDSSFDTSFENLEIFEREVFNTNIQNKLQKVQALFYKGAKPICRFRAGELSESSTSSSGGLKTDSSMRDFDYDEEPQQKKPNQIGSPVVIT
jgi:hypothetical protein